MSDILGGIIIGLSEALALTRGEPLDSCTTNLLSGTGLQRHQLKPWIYYPWEKFLVVQNNLLEMAIGKEYDILIDTILTNTPYFNLWSRIMREVASPQMMYKIVWSWFGPRNFRVVTSKIKIADSGEIVLRISMRPGYADSENFMRISSDMAIKLPIVLGLPPSKVIEREVDARSLNVILLPPRSATALSRVGSAFRRAISPSTRQHIDFTREIVASHEQAASAEFNFSALFDQAPDALLITRGDEVVAHNKAAIDLFNWAASLSENADRESPNGVPRLFSEMIRPDQREAFMAAGRQGVFELAIQGKPIRGPIVEIRNGGHITHASSDAEFFILRNETQLIELRKKAISAQRLAALGEAAASLTHEIASPVMVSQGLVDQLLRKVRTAAPPTLVVIEGQLRKAATHLKYVSDLVHTFGRFMKSGERELQSEALYDIVSFALEICELKAKRAEVRLEHAPVATDLQTTLIRCVRHEVTQAVVNIINNGIDAAAATPEKWVRVCLRSQSTDQIEVVIEDSGHIADPMIVEKMLEPFFTTKAEGTGIGLAVTSQIVKAHHGSLFISADSNTRISLRLPITPADV